MQKINFSRKKVRAYNFLCGLLSFDMQLLRQVKADQPNIVYNL